MTNDFSRSQKIDISIDFDLPYCLYLEDGTYSIVVNDIEADISLRKDNCQSTDARLEICFLTKDKIEDDCLYFAENILAKEKIVLKGSDLKEEKGPFKILEMNNKKDPPQLLIMSPTYYNCELMEDPMGVVRHSCVEIVIKQTKKREDYMELALKITNRLIDVYRYVAKAPYVQRITLNDIYSFAYNEIGALSFTYASPLEWKVVPLVNDLSKNEHSEIRRMLENNESTPFEDMLLLDAKMFIKKGDYKRALVECVVAVEPLIEKFVGSKLKEAGVSDKYRDDFFKNVTLAPQIKGLLKLFIQENELDYQVIEDLIKTNKLRNNIIHEQDRYINISKEDAEKAINCTEVIIFFIKSKLKKDAPQNI